MYAQPFTQPITQLTNFANIIQSSCFSRAVFELLDESEEKAKLAYPVAIPKELAEVQDEHVKFGYTPDAVLMEDMNIDVKPGQMIAIVLLTVAGKTTLVNLLMRFYEVNGGHIQVDGVDITDLHCGDLIVC